MNTLWDGLFVIVNPHVRPLERWSPLCETAVNGLSSIPGLTQFDLSGKELEGLRSRRWNFSSSTTRVSLEESSESGGKSGTGPENPTVEEVYRHLNIQDMVAKMEDGGGAGASASSIEDLDSPFPDSPLPDSPLSSSPQILRNPLANPMDSPLVRSSSTADGGIKIVVSASGDNSSGPVKEEKEKGASANVNISPVSSVGISASILKVKTELRDAEETAPHRKDMINSLQILGLVSCLPSCLSVVFQNYI